MKKIGALLLWFTLQTHALEQNRTAPVVAAPQSLPLLSLRRVTAIDELHQSRPYTLSEHHFSGTGTTELIVEQPTVETQPGIIPGITFAVNEYLLCCSACCKTLFCRRAFCCPCIACTLYLYTFCVSQTDNENATT